ncbi:aldehyde dehydrogenase family protein [Klebsiella pneumoniae]|nr:aldehyde dehydrogenase family protein [Klebsiella pneumoniae]
MKRVWLEAGGKSTAAADCPDLQASGSRHRRRHLYNPGQVCIAGTRLLLEESIADEFLARLKTEGATLAAGQPALVRTPPWAC